MLLDDILTRLVKLEGKLESVVNVSSANTSQPVGAIVLSSATAALHKPLKQEVAGSRPGPMSSRLLHKHILQRPHH